MNKKLLFNTTHEIKIYFKMSDEEKKAFDEYIEAIVDYNRKEGRRIGANEFKEKVKDLFDIQN